MAPRPRDDGRDPHRPVYHFLPPANWLNDPVGLVQHRGRYHLFYQCNPAAPVHDDMHWGHAVSDDLLHWEDLPPALAPVPGTPDGGGCWSGCAVDDEGTPTLLYTGMRDGEGRACLATAQDDGLVRWRRDPANPVIAAPPPGLDLVAFRDHVAWREDGEWRQLVGAGIAGVGPAALLYRSADLRTWEFRGPLVVGTTREEATAWECPDFFACDGRRFLVVSAWREDPLWYALYLEGEYRGDRFTPRLRGLVDHGRRFYAPQTLLDERGRRLMWGWLPEGRPPAAQVAAGWSGVTSLPREVRSDGAGHLTFRPPPELSAGRGRHQRLTSRDRPAAGRALELVASFAPPRRGVAGVRVLAAPDGSEQTRVVYDAEAGRVVLDATAGSLDPAAGGAVSSAPVVPVDGRLTLHVFVDHSVVEVFAGAGVAITERVYPARPDSVYAGVVDESPSGAGVQVDVWERGSIWVR